MKEKIFVFGSNRQGRHGRGAALHALLQCGAIYGQAEGLQGKSYAIITKELRGHYPPVTLKQVEQGVEEFIRFAKAHPEMEFRLTKIGCGLAGFQEQDIRKIVMSAGIPPNVEVPTDWISSPLTGDIE